MSTPSLLCRKMNFTHKSTDPWTWTQAIHTDVEEILDLVEQNYQQEITGIFTPNRTRLTYHLHDAILDQSYRLGRGNISVAKDRETKKVIAWSWVERGKYMPYSDEELAVAEFAHIDLNLSTRKRITLCSQILDIWILWCELNKIPVLCSTSIREDQQAFMHLHDQHGFSRRGSFAYRRIL